MRKYLEKNGSVLILIILGLITLFSAYTFWIEKNKSKITNPLEQKVIKAELERLFNEKKALEHKLDSQENVSKNLVGQVDSLGHLKPKIHIEYVTKENEINNSYSVNLISEFDSVFAKNNIGY
jgi:hypothetical protein